MQAETAAPQPNPHGCHQQTQNERTGTEQPAFCSVRQTGPQPGFWVSFRQDKKRPPLGGVTYHTKHEALDKIPRKVQTDWNRQLTSEHIAGSEESREDHDVDCAQRRSVWIAGMGEAE